MAAIRAIPEHAAAQVKASVLITTLEDVILGLVENSLDSDATKIDIEIDLEKGFCAVEDDGTGIAPVDFSEEGGLVKVHHTSKSAESSSIHGRNGVFLWAVASIATLSIVSLREPWTAASGITVHQGQVINREVGTKTSPLRHLRHGTRVEVRNLFGNMPVRTKQRPRASDASLARAWKRVIRDLTGTMLAWGRGVDFSLKTVNGSQKMRVSHKETPASSSFKNATPSSVVTRFQLPVLKTILLNGTSISEPTLDQWFSTSARTTKWTVRAFLSRQPCPTREIQFICLGVHYIKDMDSYFGFYEELNRMFDSSSFADAGYGDYSTIVEEKDRKSRQSHTEKVTKTKGKRVERWPMFFLRIDDNTQAFHHPFTTTSAAENEASIWLVLRALIESFFVQNNIRFWSTQDKRNATRMQLTSNGDKINTPVSAQPGNEFQAYCALATSASELTSVAESRSMIRKGKIALSSLRISDPTLAASDLPETPREGHNTSADNDSIARVISSESLDTVKNHQSPGSRFFPSLPVRSNKIKLSRTIGEMYEAATRAPWASELLKRWDNPVYHTTEHNIPQLSTTEHICAEGLFPEHAAGLQYSAFTASESSLNQAKISRSDMIGAQIISQVDEKFVLIKITPSESSQIEQSDHKSILNETSQQNLLVLVDQHAADERVKVETLLADLCQPVPDRTRVFKSPLGHTSAIKSEVLSTVIGFDLEKQECALFRRYAERYAEWGILYALSHTDGETCTSNEHTLFVLSLPPLIRERCRAEPKLLSELLRRDLWGVHNGELGGQASSNRQPTDHDSFWSRIHSCPEGILDMVNSRACRSAIMFNDVLTIEECQALIQRLGKCRLPFQCAHGRPSMVPVATLEAILKGWNVSLSASSDMKSRTQPRSFTSAWNGWNTSKE